MAYCELTTEQEWLGKGINTILPHHRVSLLRVHWKESQQTAPCEKLLIHLTVLEMTELDLLLELRSGEMSGEKEEYVVKNGLKRQNM